MFSWLSPAKAADSATDAAAADVAAALSALPPGTVCHQSVWCDGPCAKAGGGIGLLGPRFKCLVCPNVDLCKECFVGDKFPAEHSASHHVLVFPTPAPEVLQTFAFPGLKCAYCAREGFAGSAYTCAACPPPAAGVSTSVWCESCAWRAAAGQRGTRQASVPLTP
jgi:hypothetical protein